jgi:hypothetical protein
MARPMAKAFQKNGLKITLLAVLILIVVMATASFMLGGNLFMTVHDGNFYKIVPHAVMSIAFGVVGSFAAIALLIGFLRFWRDVGESYSTLAKPGALASAAKDIFTLVNLDNGGMVAVIPRRRAQNRSNGFIMRPSMVSCPALSRPRWALSTISSLGNMDHRPLPACP